MKRKVSERIGARNLRSILQTLDFGFKKLWGAVKDCNFQKDMIVAALFKDIFRISYAQLKKKISQWLPMSNTALQHNVKMIRKALLEWARSVIIPDDLGRLERLAKKVHRPVPCQNVCLFHDSSDFPVSGKRSVHKNKKKWSQKLRSPLVSRARNSISS